MMSGPMAVFFAGFETVKVDVTAENRERVNLPGFFSKAITTVTKVLWQLPNNGWYIVFDVAP